MNVLVVAQKLRDASIKIKSKTFEKVIQHLTIACYDERRREQKRARIALKSITKFMEKVINERV